MQVLQFLVTATDSFRNCNQIATGHRTQLIVATFATRIFAMYKKMLLCNFTYSCIPITQAGSIKRAGRDKFFIYYIKIASKVEKFAIYYIKIYEQAGKNV